MKRRGRGYAPKSIEWVRKPRPYPDVIGDCIICTSHAPSKRGYPRVNRNRTIINIARLVLNRRYGAQPPSVIGRHTCDDRLCINPDHIIPGTQADNVRDAVRRGRYYVERISQKLTESDVIEIRRLLSIGEKPKEIASRFGISHPTISEIKLGRKRRKLL